MCIDLGTKTKAKSRNKTPPPITNWKELNACLLLPNRKIGFYIQIGWKIGLCWAEVVVLQEGGEVRSDWLDGGKKKRAKLPL